MRMFYRPRRFAARLVESGKFKGALHVATKASQRYRGELLVLDNYLDTWLMPQEPEEATMTRITLSLQNIIEHEIELAIAKVVDASGRQEDRQFADRIAQGYVSFKSKFEWLFRKRAITETEKNVLDEIRKIRNEQIHSRPSKHRRKIKYFGNQLMTRKTLEQIIIDLEAVLKTLRTVSGNKDKHGVIPPRFFDENEWGFPRKTE